VSHRANRLTPGELAARLVATPDPARQVLLATAAGQPGGLGLALVEALKARADAELLRDATRAMQIAEMCCEVAAHLNDPLALPLALWARGNALLYLGRYRECLNHYTQARATYNQYGQALQVARLLINEIAALQNLGEYKDALRAAGEARELLAHHTSPQYQAALEMNIGIVHHERGDYAEALAAFERGRECFLAVDDTSQVARADVNRAMVLEDIDSFDQAEILLKLAHATLLTSEMAQEVARVELNLGALISRQNRYQEALGHLERARDGFVKLGNDLEAAVVDLYRAHIYLALNLLPEALTLAEECEREFAQRGMARQVALSKIVNGVAKREMGNTAAALHLFDRARRIFSRRGALVEAALVDVERADALRLSGVPARARRLAGRAARLLEERGLGVRAAQAQVVRAWCALELGHPHEAESLARAALEVAKRLSLATLAYRARHALGRAAETRDQAEEAYAHYRGAVEAIERLESALWVDEFRATFLDDKIAVYEDAVRLALALEKLEQAFELAGRANELAHVGPAYAEPEAPDEAGQALLDQLRALRRRWHWEHSRLDSAGNLESDSDPERSPAIEAATWEKLCRLEEQIAELARRWQVRCGHPTLQTGYTATPAQRSLPSTLVQYYILRGQVIAFVASPQGVERVVDLGPAQRVEQLVENWRFGLEGLKLYPPEMIAARQDSLCADAQAHLRRMYDILIAPLGHGRFAFTDCTDASRTDSDTNCTDKHGFSTDASRTGALSDDSGILKAKKLEQEPRVPRLYVSLPPALSGVPLAALFDGEHYLIEQCEIAYIAGKHPAADFQAPASTLLAVGYSDGGRLPFAVEEARQVAQVFTTSGHLLAEQAAIEAEFVHHGQQAGLIHLATHAAFRADNPFFSWLQLADARPTVADMYRLRLAGHPLVTLSACETALSGRRGGGLIGFSRALMAAGAGAVVASLWKVDDASTSTLMARFYRRLAEGQAARVALRAAQLETLHQWRHPLYWASFVLMERGVHDTDGHGYTD
jgi:tetratricopeptide (TPR) repeat protein